MDRTQEMESAFEEFDAGPRPTQRYEIDTGKVPPDAQHEGRSKEAPAGGDVEVGTMANVLMDPSDDVSAYQRGEKMGSVSSSALEVSARQYGDEKDTDDDGSSDGMDTDAIVEQLEELAPEKPASSYATTQNEYANTRARNKYLLTRTLPLILLFFVVLIVGFMYMPKDVALDGEYTAVFSDDEGREVTCTTQFQELGGGDLRGIFTCKLYESLTSLDRIDEPHVLKPVMGDGQVTFNGRMVKDAMSLRLGSLDPDDDRTVLFEGKVKDGGVRIVGSMTNSLGNKATAEMLRPELDYYAP
ncbi:MAG: hypothetical protein P9L99_19905 [Candidatus Lernaella stagnicola]|nr:hypothetical protein [Candidatus Lernaella stagnicola]